MYLQRDVTENNTNVTYVQTQTCFVNKVNLDSKVHILVLS